MNVRKIPAFASLLVPIQTARTFVAAPLVMYYDLTRERVQVIRKIPTQVWRDLTIETGYEILLLFFGGLRDKSTLVRPGEVF